MTVKSKKVFLIVQGDRALKNINIFTKKKYLFTLSL